MQHEPNKVEAGAKENTLDRSLFEIADLAAVIEAHNQHTVADKDQTRRFDGCTPYAVHPIWCGSTILTEPLLPLEVRRVGSQALFYHDFLEDLSASLPDWIEPKVRSLIEELTFPEGSAEKMAKVWTRSTVAQLCVLYDVVSNFLDGSWMPEDKRATSAKFISDLADWLEPYYGRLNIIKIARAIAEDHSDKQMPQGWQIVPYLPEVRVSIANLIGTISVVGERPQHIGILNKKALAKGSVMYGALGGAAELKPEGKDFLEKRFACRDFEGNDARFVTSGKNAMDICFESIPCGAVDMEVSAERELFEELTQEILIDGGQPILSAEEISRLEVHPMFSYRQPISLMADTSARKTNVPSIRVFKMYELWAPQEIADKILSHSSIKAFSTSEVESTRGGLIEGHCADGASIANNIFRY